jgi:hypothetical protein
MKTHSLIRTPSRRPVQIRPQINPQTLVLAHIPSRYILALHAGRTPRQSIALVSESPERILGRCEGDGQVRGGRAGCFPDVCVQFGAFGVD